MFAEKLYAAVFFPIPLQEGHKKRHNAHKLICGVTAAA